MLCHAGARATDAGGLGVRSTKAALLSMVPEANACSGWERRETMHIYSQRRNVRVVVVDKKINKQIPRHVSFCRFFKITVSFVQKSNL